MAGELASLASQYGISITLFVIIIIWSLVWKALALWKAGRMNQPIWFVLLIIVNTMGILEILYIFLFSKIKLDNIKEEKGKKKSKKRKR